MHASPENEGKPSVRKKEELHAFDRIAAHFFFFFFPLPNQQMTSSDETPGRHRDHSTAT